MSNPSLEAVVSLKPDLVILSVDGNPKEFEERLRAMKIKTYVIYSNRISELPKGIRDMGLVLGVKDKADALAADMEYRINKLKTGKKPSPQKRSCSLYGLNRSWSLDQGALQMTRSGCWRREYCRQDCFSLP